MSCIVGKRFYLTDQSLEDVYPSDIRILKDIDNLSIITALTNDNEEIDITIDELHEHYNAIKPAFVMCIRMIGNLIYRRNVIITINKYVQELNELKDTPVGYSKVLESYGKLKVNFTFMIPYDNFTIDSDSVVSLIKEDNEDNDNMNLDIVKKKSIAYGYIDDTIEDIVKFLPIDEYDKSVKEIVEYTNSKYIDKPKIYIPLKEFILDKSKLQFDCILGAINNTKNLSYLEMDSETFLKTIESIYDKANNQPDYKLSFEDELLLDAIQYYNKLFANEERMDVRSLKIIPYSVDLNIDELINNECNYIVKLVRLIDKKLFVIKYKEKQIIDRVLDGNSALSPEELSVFLSPKS